ncbi:MAG: hypothetical protein LBU73_04365 [Helicobacteraceae bacterium]|nr:hypothetical protein [Helicobacteraceae bacterium]
MKYCLNGKVKTAPLKECEAEYEKLTAKRLLLYDKYRSLKDEVENVKVLQ